MPIEIRYKDQVYKFPEGTSEETAKKYVANKVFGNTKSQNTAPVVREPGEPSSGPIPGESDVPKPVASTSTQEDLEAFDQLANVGEGLKLQADPGSAAAQWERISRGSKNIMELMFPDDKAIRNTLVGAGSLGALGFLAGGGDPLEAAIASSLGAGIGSFAGSAINQDPAVKAGRLASREMLVDAMWSGGFGAAGRLIDTFGKDVGKWVLDPNGWRAAKNALDLNIPASLTELSKNKLIQGYHRVFGAFPIVGSPTRRQNVRMRETLDSRMSQLLGETAPNSSLHALGMDVWTAANNSHKSFRTLSGNNYDAFFKVAEATEKAFPNTTRSIPSDIIKKTIDQIDNLKKRPDVITASGQTKKLPKPGHQNAVNEYISGLRNLQEFITPSEIRTIQQEINSLQRVASVQGFDVVTLAKLQEGVTLALNEMVHPALKPMLDAANQFHAAGMSKFETRAAKEFEKVDKNVFDSNTLKKLGSATTDTLVSNIIRSSTPELVKDLRTMIGPEMTIKVARAYLDKSLGPRALARVNGEDAFSFAKAERNLGLNTNEGTETLQEFLKGSGVNIEQVKTLIDLGKRHGSVKVVDPNTFLARRLILSGGTIGLATIIGSAPTIIGLALMTAGSKAISSPKMLKWMVNGLDEKLTDPVRGAALGNILNAIQGNLSEEQL